MSSSPSHRPDLARIYDVPTDAATAALFQNNLSVLYAHNEGVVLRRRWIRLMMKGMRQAQAAGRVIAGYDEADGLDPSY